MRVATIVLGLDGVGPEYLLKLSRRFNNIGKLLLKSYSFKLRSTIPPSTIPAWTSISTGLEPGELKAIDFLVRVKREYKLVPVSSSIYRGRALWDWLSLLGCSSGVLFYPALYPPYPIKGFMVSGAPIPEYSPHIAYPKNILSKLGITKNIVVSMRLIELYRHGSRDVDVFAERMMKGVTDYYKVVVNSVREYVDKDRIDLMVYILWFTDIIQHRLGIRVEEYPRQILEVINVVDEIIGYLLEISSSKNLNMVVVSDHGLGPNKGVFNLPRYLASKGYMKFRKYSRINVVVKDFLRRLIIWQLHKVSRLLGLKGLSESLAELAYRLRTSISDRIDYSKSIAFCLGHTLPLGAIYINLKGRDPKGIVPIDKYESTINSIVEGLKEFFGRLGLTMDYKVYEADEVLPDIVFTINDGEVVVEENNLSEQVYVNKPYSYYHVGSHRLYGIALFTGNDVKTSSKAFVNELYVTSIAPTILYLDSKPIPPWMKSPVIKEILSDDGFRRRGEPKRVSGKELMALRLKTIKLKGV